MAFDPDSILDSVKKVLGISFDYTVFDPEITLHINSVLSDLNQVGIGPTDGLAITDNTAVWSDFIGTDLNLNQVKSYISLRVRLLFDPPSSSYVLAAWQQEVAKFEWRLNIHRESTEWTPPDEGVCCG